MVISTAPRPAVGADRVEAVIAAVREVGDGLLRQFPAARPAVGLAEAMDAFDALNGPASAALQHALTALFPGALWADSELDGEDLAATVASTPSGSSGYVWVCDAVDGAVQYLQGIPAWCVSVALLHDGRAVLAVVHDPVHGETFHAVSGGGTFVNGRRVRATAKSDLGAALVIHGNQPQPSDPATAELAGRSFTAVYPQVMAVRNLGPAALQLAYLAAGRVDGYWQYGADPYNWVGGVLMAQEAGARVADCAGAPYGLDSPSVLVAAPGLFDDLAELLAALTQ
jgi:myo-inositol-1(or 4)-monophosphatase